MLKNAIVKMCGEIPFSTYRKSLIGEIYQNKDELILILQFMKKYQDV